jgi:tRNA/rRNA methyltransferase
VQVACYELAASAARFAVPDDLPRNSATLEEIEGYYAHLERAMIDAGFLDPAQPKRLMERIRRLYARAGLEREEVQFLRGMLAAFEKRLR